MLSTSVFATATSTIHADLIVVGLRRVGISTDGITILYPSYSPPDSVLYWVAGATQLTLAATGETVTVSGPLRFALDWHQEHTHRPGLTDSLLSLGLNEDQSAMYEASLLQDRLVLCIDAADDTELTCIFHLLHHIAAEQIALVETVSTRNQKSLSGRAGRSNASAKSPLSLFAA